MSWEQLSVHRGCRVLGSLLGNSHRDPALFQHFQRMWSRRLWSTYIIILPPVKYPKQSLYKHAKLRLFTAQAERENYTRCIVPTQILFCRNIASMIRRDSQTGGTLSHSRGGDSRYYSNLSTQNAIFAHFIALNWRCLWPLITSWSTHRESVPDLHQVYITGILTGRWLYGKCCLHAMHYDRSKNRKLLFMNEVD